MILRLFNIALLSLWAVFLLWLLTYGKGDLIRLLHPRLWWVLCIAVVVLVFFLVSLIFSRGDSMNNKSILPELPGLLILLVPLFYFSIARDARLDATTFHNRIIKNDNGVYQNNMPNFEIFGLSKSPDMLFSKILREPVKYENQNVEIVCQSFVNEELPENTAMCYRYMITCCAADALPAFVFLSHSTEQVIENNKWVKVKGPLTIIRNNEMEFPSVETKSIEYVEEPSFPWAM